MIRCNRDAQQRAHKDLPVEGTRVFGSLLSPRAEVDARQRSYAENSNAGKDG
jgi:hypothetical protein